VKHTRKISGKSNQSFQYQFEFQLLEYHWLSRRWVAAAAAAVTRRTDKTPTTRALCAIFQSTNQSRL